MLWLAIFSHRLPVSSEARLKIRSARRRTGDSAGFTQGAVVSSPSLDRRRAWSAAGAYRTKLGEIAAKHRALMERWSVSRCGRTPTARSLPIQGCDRWRPVRRMRDRYCCVRATKEISAARQAEQLARDSQHLRRTPGFARRAPSIAAMSAMTVYATLMRPSTMLLQPAAVPGDSAGRAAQRFGAGGASLFKQGDSAGQQAAALADMNRVHCCCTDRSFMPLRLGKIHMTSVSALELGEREARDEHLDEGWWPTGCRLQN